MISLETHELGVAAPPSPAEMLDAFQQVQNGLEMFEAAKRRCPPTDVPQWDWVWEPEFFETPRGQRCEEWASDTITAFNKFVDVLRRGLRAAGVNEAELSEAWPTVPDEWDILIPQTRKLVAIYRRTMAVAAPAKKSPWGWIAAALGVAAIGGVVWYSSRD